MERICLPGPSGAMPKRSGRSRGMYTDGCKDKRGRILVRICKRERLHNGIAAPQSTAASRGAEYSWRHSRWQLRGEKKCPSCSPLAQESFPGWGHALPRTTLQSPTARAGIFAKLCAGLRRSTSSGRRLAILGPTRDPLLLGQGHPTDHVSAVRFFERRSGEIDLEWIAR